MTRTLGWGQLLFCGALDFCAGRRVLDEYGESGRSRHNPFWRTGARRQLLHSAPLQLIASCHLAAIGPAAGLVATHTRRVHAMGAHSENSHWRAPPGIQERRHSSPIIIIIVVVIIIIILLVCFVMHAAASGLARVSSKMSRLSRAK